MPFKSAQRHQGRLRRHRRVRARVSGTSKRPRLAVFRSSKHIVAQLIDDTAQQTLAAASDQELKRVTAVKGASKQMAKAAAVGALVAERAKKAGISEAVFDRGGFAYHGRVKALAESARKDGLKF